MQQIHLSVVAASRNDDHGANLLFRMQYFVDGFIEQCKRHHLNAELILVEWNPPESKQSLSHALKYPDDLGPCKVRIIHVPSEIHKQFDHSDRLPLYQMIAKNVGIRRAHGKFILATNIDILFSDELIKNMRDHLKPGFFYRVNRLDIPTEIPKFASFATTLQYCRANYFRINHKYGTKIKINGKWVAVQGFFSIRKHLDMIFKLFSFKPFKIFKFFKIFKTNRIKKLISNFRLFISLFLRKIKRKLEFRLHTNACGDFTLLAQEDWFKLKGYVEWPIYSWHMDSLLLHQAHLDQLKQHCFKGKNAIYHIEHGKASGYTPEESNLLFQRLRNANIPFISDKKLSMLISQMIGKKAKNKDFSFNDGNWGLGNSVLKETIFSSNSQ